MSVAQSELIDRLSEAGKAADRPLTREDVAEILSQVVGSMEGDVSALDLKIYRELESLVQYIEAAKNEIASIRPQELGPDFIVSATDELDAVVGSTEEAAGRILDAAEAIQTVAEELEPAVQEKIIDQVTEIFEASNFQDLTGQRITKVVKTLKHIESRIEALVGILGEEVERVRHSVAPEAATDDETALLNGPQLPGNANDQDEIDRLLASFD